jgi:hypothetical protein
MIRRLATWLLLAIAPSAAFAQVAPPAVELPRADLAATVGWLHSAIDLGATAFPYDDWVHDRGTIGATAGVYWTEHLKTEVAVETSNGTSRWTTVPIAMGGRIAYRSVEHTIRDTRFSIGQYYQFGHNQWVHPSVGGGITIRRRARSTLSDPLIFYGGSGREPEHTIDVEPFDSSTTIEPAAFVAVSLKAYLTRRAFFRTDTELDFRDGLSDANARVGFGVDF